MKKSFTYILSLATLCCLIVLSCDKPLYKYNKNFEGTWRTATYYNDLYNKTTTSEIVIDGKNGIYNYACTDSTGCAPRLCNCVSQQSGRAVINTKHTQMKMGSTSSSYPITINTEPYQDGAGVWHMRVNDEDFTKQ